MKKSPKAQDEIVHIDRLTKYKNTVPPQWRKEVEREKSEQSKVGMEGTGVMSAPREYSETIPKERKGTGGPPPLEIEDEGGDHLESIDEPSAEAPRCAKEDFEDVALPTSIQDQNGEQMLAKKRMNRGKRKVQVKSRSNTWDSDQLIPSAARRQAGSVPDSRMWLNRTEQLIPQGRQLKC